MSDVEIFLEEIPYEQREQCPKCFARNMTYIPRLGGGCTVVCMNEKCVDEYTYSIPPTEDERLEWTTPR